MNSNIIGKKILLTGVNGMLCEDIIKFFKNKNAILYTEYFDVNDEFKWKEIITNFKPEIVIHAAAITNLDFCELNPDLCFETNFKSVIKMLKYLKNEKIIFISSSGVYGNSILDNFYNENSELNPTTVYHESKSKAEKYISSNYSNYLILRLGWLFGGKKNHKKNFVSKILKESVTSKTILSDNKTIGSPTYTLDVANQIYHLIVNDVKGVFNCVNKSKKPISRLEYVETIINLSNLKNNVIPSSDNFFKRKASVPKNESCINLNLNNLSLNKMLDWKISLGNYLKKISEN
jgi:dTDP-4-dehydrorhamnose reductase